MTQSPREMLYSNAWRSMPSCTRLPLRDRFERTLPLLGRRQAVMEQSRACRQKPGYGRSGSIMKVPSCSHVKPPNFVIGEVRDASICDHGLTALGGLEVEPNLYSCPIVSAEKGACQATRAWRWPQ